MINIKPLKAYTDNYIWLLETNEDVSVVDPGDASPVLKYLEKYNKNLKDILITHHHFDHTAGVPELKNKISGSTAPVVVYSLPIYRHPALQRMLFYVLPIFLTHS